MLTGVTQISGTLVVVVLFLCAPAAAATITDDFEGGTVGAFPGGWEDIGQAFSGSRAPDPSVTVVSTTDAFGNATKAASIVDATASSQGLYVPLTMQRNISISVDVRIDQFSGVGAGGTHYTDWPIDITLQRITGTRDPAYEPSMGIYASSKTETWWSWVSTPGPHRDENRNFGTSVTTGTWYNVRLDLQPLDGVMRSRITEIATGDSLLDRTDTYTGWSLADGQYNAVSFFDGENGGGSPNNLVLLDNIEIIASILAPDDPFAPLDDGSLTGADRLDYIHDTLNSWLGDSNNDGEFNSSDLVAVFGTGEYEDAVAGNSTYATGDWDGNKEFDTSDLVAAFSDGGYEVGPREGVAAVPEPSSMVLLLIGLLACLRRTR